MDFEDFQKAWQSQGGEQITIRTDILLKEVRRNQQDFWATIFWRDVKEVGVAFLLALYFFYHGWRHHDWTDHLIALACCGVGTFMIVDRVLQKRKQAVSSNSLKACIEASLLQVNHQIWLLKNILWWYLLPLAIPLALSLSMDAWRARHFNMSLALNVAIDVAIFWGIYHLNQFAVRRSLEPRRQELETLRESLTQ